MNSLVLGGILKRIYNNFDMEYFSDRLKLQKVIYLLQQCGINLGYSFSFYIYGPYSTELARDAFQIQDFSKVQPVGFEDKSIEEKFKQFLEKINPYKDNTLWLEIASSIHALKKIYPLETKNKIIRRIKDKRSQLKNKAQLILRVWSDIGWLL